MTSMEQGAYFCVSSRSSDHFNTALMDWVPGKEHEMARYKDPARSGHDVTSVTKDRLLRAVGNNLEDMHYTKATEPGKGRFARHASLDTHRTKAGVGLRRGCLGNEDQNISDRGIRWTVTSFSSRLDFAIWR